MNLQGDTLFKVLKTQYSFAKGFRKFGFNSRKDVINECYENAFNIIEESIECCRECDSRKSWKLDYKSTNEGKLKEEIIDILKFSLNTVFDLVISKDDVLSQEHINKTLSKMRSHYGIDTTEKSDTLKLLFKKFYEDTYSKTDYIIPSLNEKIKEVNTIMICRDIVNLTSKFERFDEGDLKTIGFKQEEEAYENNINTIMNIVKNCFVLWMFWSLKGEREEDFDDCTKDFIDFFDFKSNKNVKRQRRGTEEQENHGNED